MSESYDTSNHFQKRSTKRVIVQFPSSPSPPGHLPYTVFMCSTAAATKRSSAMEEGADPEASSSWSEKVEDLVESGAIDSATSFLQTLILNLQLQSPTSAVAELQLASALSELAKLYESKGFSIKADEARSRALAIKNRSLYTQPEHARVSCSAQNDGDLNTSTKSAVGDSQQDEALSEDDWEDRADYAPDELLPPPQVPPQQTQLPEVSIISLEDPVKEAPKRRGRGTFSYKKEGVYADQLGEESVDSEKKFQESTKEDSTEKNSVYGTRHVLVLDGFPPSHNTLDLENILKNFKDKFVIRWVSDTVALAVFISPSVALEACNMVNCPFSVRVLQEDAVLMGSVSKGDLEPPRQRPQTTARTAQRLIAQGMGIKLPLNFRSTELRRQEEARKNRIVTRQNLKDDAWGPDD